jgi:hypothetical protein
MTATPEQQSSTQTFTGAQIAAFLGFVSIALGSFLPWVRFEVFEADGIDGEGIYTLCLAGAGAVTMFAARTSGWAWLSFLAATGALLVGLVVYSDPEGFAERASGGLDLDTTFGSSYSVAPGLIVTLSGSILATASTFLHAGSFSTSPGSSEST